MRKTSYKSKLYTSETIQIGLLSIFVNNKESWCIYFVQEVSFSVQYATLYLALQPCISMMYSFIRITGSLPHLYGCFLFAKQSKYSEVPGHEQSTNTLLQYEENPLPCICGFPHLFIVIVSPDAMFWASPGPASHSPFPRTAISFCFLPFNFSPLPPDLLPIPQLGIVSL